MAPLDALLRTILADPHAETPRLVYADAIEDDDPDRAALVRLQCAYARLPPGPVRIDLQYGRPGVTVAVDRRPVDDPGWYAFPLSYVRGERTAVTVEAAGHRTNVRRGDRVLLTAEVEPGLIVRFDGYVTESLFSIQSRVRPAGPVVVIEAVTTAWGRQDGSEDPRQAERDRLGGEISRLVAAVSARPAELRWVGRLAGTGCLLPRLWWRRGFVEKVRCHPFTWHALGQEFADAHPVREVEFDDESVSRYAAAAPREYEEMIRRTGVAGIVMRRVDTSLRLLEEDDSW